MLSSVMLCGVFIVSSGLAVDDQTWTKNATNVLGKTLVNPAGQELGEVTDFVIGSDGQIRFRQNACGWHRRSFYRPRATRFSPDWRFRFSGRIRAGTIL